MAEADAGTFGHPSPHRDRASIALLMLGLFGGPAAWTGQLLVSYGLTSYACFPGPTPRDALPPGWAWIDPGLTILGALALVVALAATIMSWRIYARTRAEMQGRTNDLLDIGEGRSRFLAFCGVLTSGAFVTVILFETLSLYLVPPCTR